MKQKEEFITEEKVINTPAGGVLIGKDKEGQTIIPNDGSLGGFLIGRLHKDGGIKAINKGTGQPLEMQSNEIVITAPAVADTTKHNFNGQMMTNREILSKINSDGGGVSFADGGDIPAKIHTTDKEYEYGGKMVHDTDIAHNLGINSTLKKGKQQFYSGGRTYDVDAIYNAIKKGKIVYKTKDVKPFAMKYPVYDKQYGETFKTDLRKPNGIMVQLENGQEVLIDGNHRMNEAYLKGRKNFKVYYINDLREIAKFTKKSKSEIAFENGGKFDANPFLNYYFEEIKDFLKYQNNIVLKSDFTFFYRGENFTIEPMILFEDQNEESVQIAIFTIIDQDDEEVGEIKFDANSKEKKKFEAYSDFFEWNPIRFEQGGNIKSSHNHKENLVKDAEDGNTPARDLNNYNDLLDIQTDGAVGGDSGIYADGGAVALPKVAYVEISNAGTSLLNLIGSKYGSFKEFAEGVKQAYVALNKTVRSFVILESFDYNDVKLSNTSTYISNQKNTVKNFNPLTGDYKNLEKSLSNSNARAFKKDDWNDWFLSKVKPYINNTQTTTVTSSLSTNKQFDFTDTKIDVKENPDLSLKVQKRAFELGWEWENRGGKTLSYNPINYLYFTKKSISDGFTSTSFLVSPKREITEGDIFGNSSSSNKDNSVDLVRLEYNLSPSNPISLSFKDSEKLRGQFNVIMDYLNRGSLPEISVNIIAEVVTKTGKINTRQRTLNVREEFFNINNFSDKLFKKTIEETWFDNELDFNKFFENGVSSLENDVQSVLVTYAGGQKYNALDEERLLDKIVELWKSGGRSKMSIILEPQGFTSSLSSSVNVLLDTIKTSKTSIQPSTLTIKELKEYLSKEWYSELDWSDFFKSQPKATTSYKYPDYYQYSGKANIDFTTGKIYKINNPKEIEQIGNFIDDKGIKNGFGIRNINYFTPSTEEAFLAQQSGVSTSKVDDGKIKSFKVNVKEAGLLEDEVKNINQLFLILESVKKYSSSIVLKYKTPKGGQKEFGTYFRDNDSEYYYLLIDSFNIEYLKEKLNEWFPNLISDSFFEKQNTKPLITNLSKTKIWIGDNNPELSKKVQERAFELGWFWDGTKQKNVGNLDANGLYFEYSNRIEISVNRSTFVSENEYKEIFADDLFYGSSPNQTKVPNEKEVVSVLLQNAHGDNHKYYASERLFREIQLLQKNKVKDAKILVNGENTSDSAAYLYLDDNDPVYDYNDMKLSTFEDILSDIIIIGKYDWSKFFGRVKTTSKRVVPKSIDDKKFTDLKEAVSALEGFASKASEKYNTTNYEDNLQLLKEVKEEYSLALSFTPESSFMYERIELMKKINDVQKEITKITELKNGGAYYILAKVIDKLEKGEDWKESGRGEIMTNEVPEQELEAVIYTDKFKNWFGDWEQALITKEYDYISKALTEIGKPCVMYHGAKRIKYSYRQVSNGVVYLAENRSYAEWFSASENIYQKQGDYLTQCFVNIKNPIDLTVFGVEEVDLRDIIQFIDTVYPLAKIYDVLPPNTAMAIMNNQLIGRNFRAWYIIRQFPELNKHIRDNTNYDGFIYYENNPSNMIISETNGEMEENVTKATAVFNSNQVKLVDAMLFNSSLDDWRFEQGGNVN